MFTSTMAQMYVSTCVHLEKYQKKENSSDVHSLTALCTRLVLRIKIGPFEFIHEVGQEKDAHKIVTIANSSVFTLFFLFSWKSTKEKAGGKKQQIIGYL